MKNEKYNTFMNLLEFNSNKYNKQKVFKDFISLFAISLSNQVIYNKENSLKYEEIYSSYDKGERYIFYALSSELTRFFCTNKEISDILGELCREISKTDYVQILENKSSKEKVEEKLKGIFNINQKNKNGKIIETNCGTGGKILSYANMLKMLKIDYENRLEVTAIDTKILNVFMTYIQLYFYKISAVVVLVDKQRKKELMKLYTPKNEDEEENLMVA